MKSFSEEVAKMLGVDFVSLTGKGCYTVYGGKWVVVEGHSGLHSLGDECICFDLSGGTVAINGKNLILKCLSQGFAVVEGNVFSVCQQ